MRKHQYDIDYLRKYVNDELTPTEMYEIEHTMHTDEMLWDIIAGLEIEKKNKSSINLQVLNDSIKHFKHPKNNHKMMLWKYTAIAAAVLVLFSFGIYLYNFQKKSNNNSNLLAEITDSIHEDKSSIMDTTSHQNITEQQIASLDNKILKDKKVVQNNNSLIPADKNIVELNKIEPYGLEEIKAQPSTNIASKSDELILTPLNKDSIISQTELIASTLVVKPVTKQNSMAKSQADLQRMNIDPQTRSALEQVLYKQQNDNLNITVQKSEQPKLEVNASKEVKASKKANSTESIDYSTTNPSDYGKNIIQNGNPTIGWSSFFTKIKTYLKEKGIEDYEVQVTFDLDKNALPTKIQILSSTNKKVDTHIINLLKKISTWENSIPNQLIFLQIKSEGEIKK